MFGDDGFIEVVRFLWIFIVPNFAMLLALRCVDIFAYKRLRVTGGTLKFLPVELLLVVVLHSTLAVLEALMSFYLDPAFLMSSALLVPVFTVVVLVLSYYFDRKRMKSLEAVKEFVKRSFESNLIISLGYDVLYGVFLYRYFIMEISWEKSESVKSDTILLVLVVVLFAIGTVYKVLNSRRLVKGIELGSDKE